MKSKIWNAFGLIVAPILSILLFTMTTPKAEVLPIRIAIGVAVCAPMLSYIKRPFMSLARRVAKWRDLRERKLIAQHFNNRYTYRKEWLKGAPRLTGTKFAGELPNAGYAWMCPECNQIHHPTKHSCMSGLQYPACCSTGEGHRLDSGIR